MPARAVFALVLALLAAACGGDAATPPSSAGPASSSTASPSPTGAVPEVLAFEAPLLGGGSLDGAELAGKDVAFWFWAPW